MVNGIGAPEHTDDPTCTCKKNRARGADGMPHWADIDGYCPVHGVKDAVPHDLERFPQALNSYSCDPCQHGDHVGCQERIVDISWSNRCSCIEAAPSAHAEVRREAKRHALAETINYAIQYSSNIGRLDGDLSGLALDIADALIEKRLA